MTIGLAALVAYFLVDGERRGAVLSGCTVVATFQRDITQAPRNVEAVTNIVRHARARHCHVTLALGVTALAVTITDDGIGLATCGHYGNGLAIMRERAEELGGTVGVSDASPGVTVQARLPVVTAPAQVPRAPAVPA